MDEETSARLETIRAEKAAAAAKLAAEQAATEQLEKQKELAEQRAQVEERAAQKAKELAEQRAQIEERAAQAKAEAARKEAEDVRGETEAHNKVIDLKRQREDIVMGQQEEKLAQQQANIEKRIDKLRENLEFQSLPRAQRRAMERQEARATRDKERRQKKVARLRERQRRGHRLGRHELEMLALDDTRGQLAEQLDARKKVEQNRRILADQQADIRRKRMITELDNIRREIHDAEEKGRMHRKRMMERIDITNRTIDNVMRAQ
jgi:hypothetical protein